MTFSPQQHPITANPVLNADDFATDQEVRWCPGCGDYAILKAVRQMLAERQCQRHNTVFVSGIGCASRFPYYINTYGFHTIHGRAPTIATGLKLTNPDLDIWLITGDGDGLSIGGNHLYHLLRRNLNIQLLLFNNEAYGLTKGQYSPTSRVGFKTPSTPYGSVDHPVNPCHFALGSGATFIARSLDTARKSLIDCLSAAHDHKGTAFVEILQNCPVYNDGVFDDFTDKKNAPERLLTLQHGQPLRFGKNNQHGLRFNLQSLALEVVTPGQNNVTDDDILIHDSSNPTLATLLATLPRDGFPLPIGVIHQSERAVFEDGILAPYPSHPRHLAKVDPAARRAALTQRLHNSAEWHVD